MVMYNHDKNTILAEPIKSHNERKLLLITTVLHQHLTSRGLKPTYQIIDNKCPALLKHFLRTSSVFFQLLHPHIHRTNTTERAIQTYNNNFIAGISSFNPSFPLQFWDRLAPQATLTLNLMRSSRINPRLSAKAQLNDAFNFNETPLAPQGTRVTFYKLPGNQRTWALHGGNGWFLGQAR